MNKYITTFIGTIKRTIRQLVGLLPTRLPVGVEEFDAYISSLRSTYTLPTVSDEDVRYVVSSLILHLGPTAAFKPKAYFYLALQATAAKQIASHNFQQVKQRQAAAEAARKAALSTAEATALKAVASDGTKI